MTTISSSTGSSCSSIPVASLSASTATTPISRRNENDSPSAATLAAIPCGLCAASTMTVGAPRTTSSRPGELTPTSAARTTSTSITPVFAPAPRNASTAASATAVFCAWCAPCSGTNRSS